MVQDWPDFDKKIHRYIVATAGGDGWEASWPIVAAIENDKRCAIDNESTNEGIKEIELTPIEEWIDYLAVYQGDDEIAVWKNGEWSVL